MKAEFDKKYITSSRLGSGGFGSVYAGFRVSDQYPVAIKVVPKRKVLFDDPNQELPNEVLFMLRLNHLDGIIKLLDYFDKVFFMPFI